MSGILDRLFGRRERVATPNPEVEVQMRRMRAASRQHSSVAANAKTKALDIVERQVVMQERRNMDQDNSLRGMLEQVARRIHDDCN